ncbi:MvdC/MvdD family ATP grasp protein [Thermogemmatispora tikiterensis]|uniref:ATP-grasp domain-containing protein n=1 Tax=Thermogemmatispora tikiterensis TaxID=1825093 RepID=A0A328VJ61_9CHLR|nr:ATP-grasp ribosomal peptide maturase [Thermogemmatispora tikiterensis]RAQ95820.1 hypothetical protein A4R35_09755 [Thermogemmatispora tikiterensis]
MAPPLIGIYSQASDAHVERVVTALRRQGCRWIHFDDADVPLALQLSAELASQGRSAGWQGHLILRRLSDSFPLAELSSLWYRRPSRQFGFPKGMTAEGVAFATAEARHGLGGLLRSLPCLWVSHPDAIRAASWKPLQLVVAQQLGWRIPRTLLTNDPQAALDFFERCEGRVVYKPLSQGLPRVAPGQWQGGIYTTRLSRQDLQAHLSTLALTFQLFQEAIPKRADVRVTVIGARLFAVAMTAPEDSPARLDFRLDYGALRYEVHQLPAAQAAACLALVGTLRLQFAAIDLVLTPEGEYVFLELNPNGQWGWLEDATGLPLAASLAALLAGQAERCPWPVQPPMPVQPPAPAQDQEGTP